MSYRFERDRLFESARSFQFAARLAETLGLPLPPDVGISEVKDWFLNLPLEYQETVVNLFSWPELSADEELSDDQLAERLLTGALSVLDLIDHHPES